jgi:hypothetical protein
MWRFVLAALLTTLLPASGQAVPMWTAEHGALPDPPGTLRDDECRLGYYNMCSEWVFWWDGYCWARWDEWSSQHPQFGTCFDLADCPGSCRHLVDVWWACRCYSPRGAYANVEIYCADDHACPVGDPLVGHYNCWLGATGWHHYSFDSVEVCPCDSATGKIVVLITLVTPDVATNPYSDINAHNIDAGCETEWRCRGHSFVYRSAVSYCDVYGTPGPMWVSYPGAACTNYPTVPPGCHNTHYDTGFFTEWLIHCYISCEGPTETEEESWSAVKALYR